MSEEEKKFWFPAKRYGWGWGLPCRWQGWVVLLIYLLLILATAFLLHCETHPTSGSDSICSHTAGFLMAKGLSFDVGEPILLSAIALLTLGLISICWIKGEKPRWRWGKD